MGRAARSRLSVVLASQAQPQYIFTSTWNEFIAQPQTMTIPPPISMGFETDPSVGQFGFVGVHRN